MTLLDYLRLLLFTLSGSLVLCTVFASDPMLADGLVMGKVCWFHASMLCLAGCMLFGVLTGKKSCFTFSWADGALLLLAAVVLVTYDWTLNPEPMKLLFGGQLVMLWFMLRGILGMYPALTPFFLSVIMGTGLLEAVWGMGQLHGVYMSNHALFRLTGSFFNPGPFSGYMAVVLPVCLGVMLALSDCRKNAWWQMRTVLFYLSVICTVGIVVVLPAGMSRSAWLAAIVSCGWVLWMYTGCWNKVRSVWGNYRRQSIAVLIVGVILGVIGLTGIYRMKKDSADGRLLMWKVTAKAMADQPLTGTGIGGFPATFAKAQAEYFASGEASETEKMVAGCPEYAFNEYLQIGVELGVGGLLVFLAWLGCILYDSIKNKRYGMSGGILSLMIFAFSSYPLQLPSFWVLLFFLSAMGVTGSKGQRKHVILFALGVCALYGAQVDSKNTYQQWNRQKMLYNNKAYQAASEGYEALYPKLNHRPEFLFESAQCLSKTGNQAEAIVLLERAVRLSADPMLYYMLAKNEEELGRYSEAEAHLLFSIDVLPERLYPYFLLTKLYAEPLYYQSEKLQAAVDSVFTKEPKVQTTAVKEMRQQVEKMLKNISDIR